MFLKFRIRIIKGNAEVLKVDNILDYSFNKRESCRKNQEMNFKWFVRDYHNIKKKLSIEEFRQLQKYFEDSFNIDSFEIQELIQ